MQTKFEKQIKENDQTMAKIKNTGSVKNAEAVKSI